MRIGMGITEAARNASGTGAAPRGRRSSKVGTYTAKAEHPSWMESGGNMLQRLVLSEAKEKSTEPTDSAAREINDRSDTAKIYEAALNGGKAPISSIRTAPKVPYGYLAKDGVISYNGVSFICDEKTNSICLGDMTDKKQVINIPLSDGGHLMVNRANIGQLSKAIGMFSPEDVNRILRAIHLDTKVQSVQNEVEDLEAGVGEEIASNAETAE